MVAILHTIPVPYHHQAHPAMMSDRIACAIQGEHEHEYLKFFGNLIQKSQKIGFLTTEEKQITINMQRISIRINYMIIDDELVFFVKDAREWAKEWKW